MRRRGGGRFALLWLFVVVIAGGGARSREQIVDLADHIRIASTGMAGGSPPPITADDVGWTAKPTTPDPALLDDAERLCLREVRRPDLRGKLVIQDQRG